MTGLLDQVKNNLSFLLVCIAMIAVLILLSRLAEHWFPHIHRVTKARRLAIVAMSAAIAAILHMIDFPLLFLAPEFYRLDFSELPVMLCGFYLGPSAAVACEGIKVLLKLIFKSTSTAFVGDFSNFIVGCSFALPAACIYHLKKSKKSALLGLIVGSAVMTAFGSALNAVYLLPKFSQLYGIPLESIIAMGSSIFPSIHSVQTFVLFCVAPLNLIKGISVSVLTLLLYKRIAHTIFEKK